MMVGVTDGVRRNNGRTRNVWMNLDDRNIPHKGVTYIKRYFASSCLSVCLETLKNGVSDIPRILLIILLGIIIYENIITTNIFDLN